jgi:ribulose bisphosphate carboxylase small subunit
MIIGYQKSIDMTERQLLHNWGKNIGKEPYPKTAFNKGFWLAWKMIKAHARKAKTIKEFWAMTEEAQNDLALYQLKKHPVKFEGRYVYSAGYMDGVLYAMQAIEKLIEERE